jgi:hypothetical protein
LQLITCRAKKSVIPKLAIFAEGQTEQLFLKKLLVEMAGRRQLKIESVRAQGGRKFERFFFSDRTDANENPRHRYFAIIYDCSGDERVASDLRERYRNLVDTGYNVIIAVRDVHPNYSRNEIPRLRRTMESSLPQDPIKPTLVLATMEVEAWFIGEHSHFARIDRRLTRRRIRIGRGFDIVTGSAEGIDSPASELGLMYNLCGKQYSKGKADVQRTIDALNYRNVTTQLSPRVPSIGPLIDSLNAFLNIQTSWWARIWVQSNKL